MTSLSSALLVIRTNLRGRLIRTQALVFSLPLLRHTQLNSQPPWMRDRGITIIVFPEDSGPQKAQLNVALKVQETHGRLEPKVLRSTSTNLRVVPPSPPALLFVILSSNNEFVLQSLVESRVPSEHK